MIKVKEKELPAPENLLPVIFRCLECGSTIRYLEKTNSYFLVALSPQVEKKTKKICSYCYRLSQLRGPTS